MIYALITLNALSLVAIVVVAIKLSGVNERQHRHFVEYVIDSETRHARELREFMESAKRERQVLLTRIQAPEEGVALGAGMAYGGDGDVGEEADVDYMDDEREIELQGVDEDADRPEA